MVKLFFLFGLSVVVDSCVTVVPLSFQRIDNHSNSLNLNGYYYTNGVGVDSNLISSYFLYKNGIVKKTGSIRTNSLSDVDNNIYEDYIKRGFDSKVNVGWGVYKISGSNVIIEYWLGAMDWHNDTQKLTGKIENNTTFRIIESKYSGDEKKQKVNMIYHFRPFNPKPDSTNNFIK